MTSGSHYPDSTQQPYEAYRLHRKPSMHFHQPTQVQQHNGTSTTYPTFNNVAVLQVSVVCLSRQCHFHSSAWFMSAENLWWWSTSDGRWKHITVSDVVQVLGDLLTPNLSLDKHFTLLSAKCFFQLRPTTTQQPTFTRRPLHRHTGARVCRQPRRLLRWSTGCDWCTEEDNKSCNASSVQRHVGPRSNPVPMPYSTLARRCRQAGRVCSSVQVSAQHGSCISGSALLPTWTTTSICNS